MFWDDKKKKKLDVAPTQFYFPQVGIIQNITQKHNFLLFISLIQKEMSRLASADVHYCSRKRKNFFFSF